MNRHDGVELSVVVPVYGCVGSLDELRRRVAATLDARQIPYELVLVDDASRDGGSEVVARLGAEHAQVVAVIQPSNTGQHAAIAVGLGRARGAWAAVMDCDLEDPPELLPRMLEVAGSGKHLVVGRRLAQAKPLWRRLGSGLLAVLASRKTTGRLVGTHSVFSVLSREAVERYLTVPERTEMYLPVIESLGFPIVSFDYERSPRAAGRSGYGVVALVRRAVRMLVGNKPGARM